MASFGRYPDRRPHGLRVCLDGTIRVQDIVDCWGASRGVSRQQIVTAVQEHMFHNDECSSLRFVLSEDSEGHLIVRVMAKRAPKDSRGYRRAHQLAIEDSRGRHQVSPFATASPQHASMPGRVAREANRGSLQVWLSAEATAGGGPADTGNKYAHSQAGQAPTGPAPGGLASGLSTSEKLDLSLDDLLRADAGRAPARQSRMPDVVDLTHPNTNKMPGRPMEVEVERQRARSEEADSASPRRSKEELPARPSDALQVGQLIAEAGPEHGRKPDPPPGDHWKQFNCETSGPWWYYEGPLGTWVCQKDKQVMPTEPLIGP